MQTQSSFFDEPTLFGNVAVNPEPDPVWEPVKTIELGLPALTIEPSTAFEFDPTPNPFPEGRDITTTDGVNFYQCGRLWLTCDSQDPDELRDAIFNRILETRDFNSDVWTVDGWGNPTPFVRNPDKCVPDFD